MCLKMGMIPPTSMTMSLKEGPVGKGNLYNVLAHGDMSAPTPMRWHRQEIPVDMGSGTCECHTVTASPGPRCRMALKDSGPRPSCVLLNDTLLKMAVVPADLGSGWQTLRRARRQVC